MLVLRRRVGAVGASAAARARARRTSATAATATVPVKGWRLWGWCWIAILIGTNVATTCAEASDPHSSQHGPFTTDTLHQPEDDDDGDDDRTILRIAARILAWQAEHRERDDKDKDNSNATSSPSKFPRPFVLASFAQSLDGQLAPWKESTASHDDDSPIGDRDDPLCNANHPQSPLYRRVTAANFPLSGPKSLRLTHHLRAIHDGVLVGGRTLSTDNPRLNNRLWGDENAEGGDGNGTSTPEVPASWRHQPIPIVVDTTLRHVTSLGPRLRAQNLVVACGLGMMPHDDVEALKRRIPAVSDVLLCPMTTTVPRSSGDTTFAAAPVEVPPNIDLHHLLYELRNRCNIQTLMVEGGAELLTSFFQQGLVDAVCITIAPTVLCGGVGPTLGSHPVDLREPNPSETRSPSASEPPPQFVLLGGDCIFLGKWPTRKSPDRTKMPLGFTSKPYH